MNTITLLPIARLAEHRRRLLARAEETESRFLASTYRRKAADLELEIARRELLNASRNAMSGGGTAQMKGSIL